jgi:hypothetical protein
MACHSLAQQMNGGESGIRTHDPGLTDNGFQDRRYRPLSHLSKQRTNE